MDLTPDQIILFAVLLFVFVFLIWGRWRYDLVAFVALLAALLTGMVFGLALGPCTFVYMAPMLGIAFKKASKNLLYGILLILVYGVGHCSVIVFAGTFTELVQRYLNWNEKSKGAIILKKICGVLVLLAGFYLIYTAP